MSKTEVRNGRRVMLINSCQKTHKLACGMNDILIEQGLLGYGESLKIV